MLRPTIDAIAATQHPELVDSFPADERATVKVGQVGKLLKALKKFGAGSAVMVGQVTPGKLFRGLHPDLKAVRLLAGLDRRNAETIFGAIADEIGLSFAFPSQSLYVESLPSDSASS